MRRAVASLLLLAIYAGAATLHAQATRLAIDETAFVTLGGLEQWISIRGDRRSNPVLLVVHGGPGEAQWPQADVYKAWERAFTVVQWDQRGAGHTFGRHGKETPDVTLARIARDGVELADSLRQRLGKDKIIVLGHSWGSIVATHMIQTRPSLFAAYVGTGQVSSWAAGVDAQYELVMAKARSRGDPRLIAQIEADRPDPASSERYFEFSAKYQIRSLWPPSDRNWLQHLRSQFSALQATDPVAASHLADGMAYQAGRVLPDQIATNLPATACDLRVPYFVIQGKDDIVTPTKAAAQYFACVRAPTKAMILLDGAGHFAFMTASRAFLQALTTTVRPTAVARGAQASPRRARAAG